jgi:NAD+ synthase (glutamine-hydrolysing)
VNAQPLTSLYRHGFVRLAAAVPTIRIADPRHNAARTIELAREAAQRDAAVVAFPELGLTGYSADDLFHQEALLGAARDAVAEVVAASRELAPVLIVGAPLATEQRLFNCAVVIHRGRVLGVVPKSYLPNYREFYEKRQFSAARSAVADTIEVAGERVPFGPDIVFECADVEHLQLHVEVCEDVWTPIPPSTYAAMAGATVLVNLSASNITVGKADYRRGLCFAQSSRTISAYVYTAAGAGESTTDMAWDGQALITENGDLLAEAERFTDEPRVITADIDLDRLVADRMRMTSFIDAVADHRERVAAIRRVGFTLDLPAKAVPLERSVPRFPYVPADSAERDERCEETYRIQVQGLATRLRLTGIEKIVIGVSGGLDSTHALVVAVQAMEELGLPRTNVLGYTLPGFATSSHTLANAHELMRALGITAHEIDIRPSATQMLRDLGHPAGEGEPVYDVTYENVQAGERTSHLFRLANQHRGIVLGTGDLSELALGWATYGVGDQMSHYNVNASVPKTLIQFLVRWAADTEQLGPEASDVLRSIAATEISPELIPLQDDDGDQPRGDSESVVGPYELQDFFLYYVLRFGYRPSKIAFLADHAWGDPARGAWPELVPEELRGAYAPERVEHWLGVFLERFFHTSQFKRSAMPNAPKVGSGGSLSPRADWRAPSDGTATTWLEELRAGRRDGEAS